MNKNINILLDHSLEYARELLIDTGESYPFGAFLDTLDNVHPLEMDIDKKKMPQNGEVIESLEKYCKEEMESDKMNGCCMAYEVQLNLEKDADPVDAIAFNISYKDEKDIPIFYLPFSFDNNKTVVFQEVFAVK